MTKQSHPSAGGAYVVDRDGKLKRDDAEAIDDKGATASETKPAKKPKE